ncbi:hypothetical protein THII_2672 [Thioploca ingrica]|uniref:Fibronectin type-III domain-containing protein n=1 Tax=Thioploca ingrica TaxID=40754 RepID=A0A090AI13_9GAMM|nr:hypothetical protein THII_2672 [Thioploca ingrica]
MAECNTLINLYNNTDGGHWSDNSSNNWNVTDTPCTDWAGIMCSERHVISINRREQNLSGSIPDLSVLTGLQYLYLSDNQLSGPISDLSTLTQLQEIELHNNQLTGSIPDWSMLTQLKKIELYNNQLTGAIPDLGKLADLEILTLGANPLTAGLISDWISKLTHLKSLDLSHCQRTGTIPDFLGTLTQLEWLSLNKNQLTGSIPNWINNLKLLQTLLLADNQLTGSIPDLSTLINLQTLDLSVNQLSGSIPNLSTLSNLQTLDLSANQLSGSIPNLSTLSNLQKLYLGINRLSGTIPDLSASLQFLDLSVNQLGGFIPVSLSTLTDLKELTLDYNRLTAQDPKLIDFLINQNRNWADTQTIPPTDLQATPLSENSVQISWTPILYTDDGGYYQVKYAADPDQPYIPAATTTADKNATSYVVTGLSPGTLYYFVVETFTPAHDLQQNDLTSDLSIGISATTKVLPNPSTPDPSTPTPDPSTTTPNPSTPTPDPSTPTPDPSTPTPDPSTSTPDPSTKTPDPSTTTPDPSTTTPDPSTTTPDPSTTTPDPSTTTPDPSITTPDPSTKTPDPLTKTPDPIPIISTTPLPQTMNLTVRFIGNGHGRVTSNPSGINCNSSEPKCSYFPNTTSWVTLIATPEFDSEFAGWDGYQSDCNDGKVFMSDNRSCTAHFNLLRFPLTVTTVGKGKVNITSIGVECRDQCRYLVDMNTKMILTAVPEVDWQFESWQGNCDQNGQVTVNKEKQCQAVFVKVTQSTTGVTPTNTSNTSSKLIGYGNQPILVDNCSNQTSSNCSATITSPPFLRESNTTVPIILTDELQPITETITLTENRSTVAVPHLLINPASYDFGNITVGNTSSAQVFTLTNIGEANLQLGQLTLPNQEFILTDACSNQTLSTGNHCSVIVIFQPQSVGMKIADLAIPTNNPKQDTITVIPLKGRGNAIVTVNPKAINSSRPLLVTFSSPLTAVITSKGVELNWEIAVTDSNPIAATHLWRAKSVNGDCPQDINQYDQRTALELKNEPHLDYQGTDTACYGLQTIEYNGKISWYITPAR